MFDFIKRFFKKEQTVSQTADLYLFNTLSQKKERFEPKDSSRTLVYSCGPTVYKKQHIGNMRAFVFADTLHRVLKYNSYGVKHVINITDVGHLTDDADDGEDKLEKSAKEEGKRAQDIAREITELFMQDLKYLNLDLSDYEFPRATEYIAEQIEIIQQLEKKGYTYRTSDGIYFDSSKFKDYGKLGGINLEDIKEGARIGKNPEKRNPTDFALWKFSKEAEKRQQEWDSPWGLGFPGWHIECSAMSRALLGVQIDIHTGGIEHISVHHNNEIAQSECSSGVSPFVKYWLHAGHLKVDGEKMSKSLGNVLYLSDLQEKSFDALDFRYLLLGAHYKSELNFTWEALESAKRSRHKILRFVEAVPEIGEPNQKYKESFISNINDDLNTAKALASLWVMLKDNSIRDTDKLAALLDFDKVLAIGVREYYEKSKNTSSFVPRDVKKLAEERQKARSEKNWQEADMLREKILKSGYKVIDKKDGFRLEKI